LARKHRDVVLFVDSESRHNRCPLFRALRGHHINPSEAPESKGNSEINRSGQTRGDGAAEMIAGDSW
jgi:hypothetical protein